MEMEQWPQNIHKNIYQNEEEKEVRQNLQCLIIPRQYLMRFATFVAEQDSPGKEMKTSMDLACT